MNILEKHGYRKWKTEPFGLNGYVEQWQKRVDTAEDFNYPLCNLNDKLHIDVKFHSFSINGASYESYEMYICAENIDGDWCDIKIYSITQEQLEKNIEKYETKLLNMWSAFCDYETQF